MAIIDSVRKLAEKVGADTNGRTIADQLNIINQKLDSTQPGSRDIAEAASKFADKEDGTAILITKSITANGTYKAEDDSASGYSSVTVNVATPTPETFNVEMEIDKSSSTISASSNKTLSEALSALSQGKKVVISASVTDETTATFTSVCCGQVNVQGFDGIAAILYTQDATSSFILTWAGDSETAIDISTTAISLLIPPQM